MEFSGYIYSMRITIESHNPNWTTRFRTFKKEIELLLDGFKPVIEHIGSTSVPGLAAKPVIDIQVGVKDENLFNDIVKSMLIHPAYIYYEVFNISMPGRRLFVRLKDDVPTGKFERVFKKEKDIPHEQINPHRAAHVHIWKYDTEDWTRHIAFREYLKSHESIKQEYESLKKQLSTKNWEHGMAYNEGKDAFIKREERKALEWYIKNK